MEEVLHAAGVTIETEAVAQKNAIAERIRRSIIHSSTSLSIPQYTDIPLLSPLNMQRLLNEMKKEVDATRGLYPANPIALMKFRFLESLVMQQQPQKEETTSRNSAPIKEENVTGENFQEQTEGLLQRATLTPTPSFSAYIRDDSKRAAQERRQVLNSKIKDIFSELETAPVAIAQQNRRKKPSTMHEEPRIRPKEKKSPPSRKRTAPETNIATVHCPVCDSYLPLGSLDAATVLDNHIDRCGRRASTRSTRTPSPAYNSSALPVDDFVEYEESSDESKTDNSYKLSNSDVSGSEDSVGDYEPETTDSAKRHLSPYPALTPTSSKKCRSANVEVLDDWIDDAYVDRVLQTDTTTITTPYGAQVNSTTWNAMYEYQREGSKWLWGHYTHNRGGILGDEMGLGRLFVV